MTPEPKSIFQPYGETVSYNKLPHKVMPLHDELLARLELTGGFADDPQYLSEQCRDAAAAIREQAAQLEGERNKKRPFSDKLANEVIKGQVKEIDRLTKLVQTERAEHDALLEYARKVKGDRDVHSVYEVLDLLTQERTALEAKRRDDVRR